MSTAVVAAVTAILGIAVGRLWDSRTESARWRRDQKTASYQSFAEQFQALNEVLRVLATADPTADSYADRVERIRLDDFKGWDSAFTSVWLHGSAEVVAVATQLDQAVTDLFYRAQERQLVIDEWKQARVPARQAFERFIAAIRDELRLPPAPVRFFPHTQPGRDIHNRPQPTE
ncbi:hypothetical protein OH799_11280 [Nocardia sp. NBC_00881]|uniref:hypothetical protein n=1 Tax=Nocardia sp. NBC_00881 TaxID=2975995 RepID=UPI00386DCC13|nr:hypothetical protein OH799_11280 [Nocardia sp. NBC_00881]